MKAKLGKPEPAFSVKTGVSQVLTQKRFNELVEDFDAMYNALLPFAELQERIETAPLGVTVRVYLAPDLKKAKEVLEAVYARVEARRVAQAERQMAGNGDVCRLCGSVIEGSEDYELKGYCSRTCVREDGNSEFPSPDPMWELQKR